MSGFDPALCAHQIQADWIAPPARGLLAIMSCQDTYAGFRHRTTGQVVLATIQEAYELISRPAVFIKQATTLDGQTFEALVCYDATHRDTGNCYLAFPLTLSLVLPEAS
jgi:hypothetical protein